jgi:Cysteine-rich secretory protein family
VTNSDQPLSPIETAMAAAVNAYRQSRGLPTLEISPSLRRAALWKSANMANGGPYDHADADGRYTFDRFRDCGYNFANAGMGENLANVDIGFQPEREVVELLTAWKASPLHEMVQTDPSYHAFGIARVAAGTSVYWTVTFGSVMDSQGTQRLSIADVRLPSLDEDPCLPDAGQSDCDPDRLALWSGDPDAWAVQLQANGVAVTPQNIVLQTLYYRSDRGSAIARALLIRLGVTP